ncbi:tetratricopeptide repeat protein [Ruania rhizosphaerae]|uniref:tetratricopeptide repeat protein n=1 Tax=Ruania rhizosphaerae TaxID=1840413 RepID=UPI001F351405|nr:tetratricopeptide repeat protein [Ruania rhizosphaerae]
MTTMGPELPPATYSIDDEDLRDRPDDVEAARQRVAALAALGEDADAERIGWLRMLGELGEAERVGWAALARAGGPSDPALVGEGDEPPEVMGPREGSGPVEQVRVLPVAAIGPALRLAHVLQWQRRFALADLLFRRALHSAESACVTAEPGSRQERVAIAMKYFAWQHGGKSLFDQDRYDEALEWFLTALRLRQEAGAPDDQLASTRQAIAATRRRLM